MTGGVSDAVRRERDGEQVKEFRKLKRMLERRKVTAISVQRAGKGTLCRRAEAGQGRPDGLRVGGVGGDRGQSQKTHPFSAAGYASYLSVRLNHMNGARVPAGGLGRSAGRHYRERKSSIRSVVAFYLVPRNLRHTVTYYQWVTCIYARSL